MKTTRLFSVVIALLLALSITTVAKTTVELKDAQGKSVGTAVLWSKSGKGASSGVFIKASLHDLPPGVHAFHFHQKAQCDAPDFKSAGPHFNPDGKKHGLENPEGHHAGDHANITIGADGKANFRTESKDVTWTDGPHSIITNGGLSLVIHA